MCSAWEGRHAGRCKHTKRMLCSAMLHLRSRDVKSAYEELASVQQMLSGRVMAVNVSITMCVCMYACMYAVTTLQASSYQVFWYVAVHHHHHLRLTFVHACMLVVRFLHMRPLHLTRCKYHSHCKPNSTKSLFTHPSQVFLPLPLSHTSASNLLHAETQSSLFFLSSWPNHCSLLRLTASVMYSMPSRLLSSALTVLLFKWTPHIQLTIIRSALSNLAISSTFIAQVSLALWIQALYS